MNITRRRFVQAAGAVTVAGVVGMPHVALGAGKKVVVVGGGTGGATAAKYLRMADPSLDVTLIEADQHYYACYLSNEVLSGDRALDSLKFGYSGLAGHGVRVVHDTVTSIEEGVVKTQGGASFSFDRCIVAPGVDFKWEAIEGYGPEVLDKIPHAWKAGPQTTNLRNQLKAMKDGGTVIIVAPPNPFRCPPGPYERASQIAMYLQRHKPKSKVLILDPKDTFSKFGLFTQAWKKLYGFGTDNSMITWVNGAGGGTVESLDVGAMSLQGAVEEFKGDVINIIPPQKAGHIAQVAGLTNDSGWCPVDLHTFESSLRPGIHVIGDAAVATSMPKSGYAANSQAKVCAASVVALLSGQKPPVPSYVNTCYSIAGENYGFSVAAVYQLAKDKSKIEQVGGGLTPMDASPEHLAREVTYAHSWLNNIVTDVFM
jgi:sulfide dehydrogenase [flavocytochrome c] flavoprotein subunit